MQKVRRIAGNALSLLTSDVLNRATTFVFYALVARYLGAFVFGQASLALLLFYTFQIFAALGLRILITREVSRDRSKAGLFLVHGSVTVLLSSLLSLALLLVFVWVMGYATSTALVIMLLSIGVLPYSLANVCEAIFQANERMIFIAYANVPANITKIVLSILLLERGYGIYALMLLLVLCHLMILVIEWYLMLRYITRPAARFDRDFALGMIRQTVPFLGLDSMVAIWTSLNAVLLSKMTSEVEVGLYTAAMQILVPANLVFVSLVLSVFPVMCRKFDTGVESLRTIYLYVVEMILAVALPSAVGLFFLAQPLLLLLYKDQDFAQSTIVLQILAWSLIPLAMTRVLGQVLLASLQEKVTLRISLVNTVVSLVFGIILIAEFGIVGAAIAALLTRVVNFFQHYIPVWQLLTSVPLWKAVWKPALASVGMGVYLWAVAGILGLWVTMASAGVLYVVVLLTLLIWSSGGIQQLKARYI